MTVKQELEVAYGQKITDEDVIHILVELRRKRKKGTLTEKEKTLCEKIKL